MSRIYKRLPAGKSWIAFLTLLIAGSLNSALSQAQCTPPGSAVGSTGCIAFTYKGQSVTYTTVRAADGHIWLQQNLGGAVATAKNDTLAYGDCFQWGRWDDGHQSRNAATGAAPAPNNPSGLGAGSAQFIIGSGTAAWWNGGQLSDTWDAATVSNATATQGVDPCKSIGSGWRLPTQAEWAGVVNDEAITTPDLAFGSNLKLTVGGSRSSLSGNFDFVGTRGYYWSSTTSATGAKYYYFSAAVNNPSAGNTRGGGASVRCLNTGTVTIIDSVAVNTFNNVAAVISTNGGTLQMESHIYPTLISQAVTWSIAPGTGAATINTTGLVTAQSNGTVWAKAVSVFDPTKSDSLLITISNQVVPVTGIDVKTLNNLAAAINTNAGTLQMVSEILPINAVQDVTWSIVTGTGAATIANTGLVTAQSNGTVWAKATAVTSTGFSDSLQITISGQGSTSIAGVAESIGLAVYPNPAGQVLHISITKEHPALALQLTDLYGRIVNVVPVKANRLNTALVLPVANLTPGIYFLRLKGEGISITQKIVKQ